jgi:hypothetical protein
MERAERRDSGSLKIRLFATPGANVFHGRVRMKFSLGLAMVGIAVVLLGNREAAAAKDGPEFGFVRDTFAFPNETIFDYHAGVPYARRFAPGKNQPKRYTSRCFVMSRSVVQFKKFARFEPKLPPPDDAELARRLRLICRQHPWEAPCPEDQRVVISGYRDLSELSEKRTRVVQENIGLGWPTYFRFGNWRMFGVHSRRYQAIQRAELEDALRHDDFFVAYLTTFPSLSINHAVLVYSHGSPGPNKDKVRYRVYDPNHPDKPRELDYSLSKREFSYEKDWDFLGGFVRVYHVYGRTLQ